jgi:signal recognition particle GTPase
MARRRANSPVHESAYDPSARFDALAAERTAALGRAMIDAADAFRAAVVDCLEEWEDEYDGGDSLRRPGNFADAIGLFEIADRAATLARAVQHRRDLSYVLSTEPLAAEAA